MSSFLEYALIAVTVWAFFLWRDGLRWYGIAQEWKMIAEGKGDGSVSPLPTIPGNNQPLWKISYFDHNGVQRCIRDLPAKDIPARVSDLMWDGTAEMWVQVQSGIDVSITRKTESP